MKYQINCYSLTEHRPGVNFGPACAADETATYFQIILNYLKYEIKYFFTSSVDQRF